VRINKLSFLPGSLQEVDEFVEHRDQRRRARLGWSVLAGAFYRAKKGSQLPQGNRKANAAMKRVGNQDLANALAGKLGLMV